MDNPSIRTQNMISNPGHWDNLHDFNSVIRKNGVAADWNDLEYSDNMLPVDRKVIVSYVYNLLDEYHEALRTGNIPSTDPYRQDIVMKVINNGNGRFIRIPDDLQKELIQNWTQKRGIYPRPSNKFYGDVNKERNMYSNLLQIDRNDDDYSDQLDTYAQQKQLTGSIRYVRNPMPVRQSAQIVNECKTCQIKNKEKDNTLVDKMFQLILCLILIFTILYTLSLIRQGVIKF